MFERFTEEARKVVVLTQEEAMRLNHNYIGTEHLLLGLLREDEGAAARALGSLNVTLDEVREQVESIVGYGEEGAGGQAPFTPRSKKVLELALREALQLEHNYIGTEHILLGLVGETGGVAARVLSNLGATPHRVRDELLRMLDSESPLRGSRADARLLADDRPGKPEFQDYRGRTTFEVQARCVDRTWQSPQAICVDLEYAYAAQKEDVFSESVDHDKLRRGVTRIFEEQAFPFVETGIARVEGYIRNEFSAIRRITTSVRMRQEPKVTVSRTFVR